MFEVLEIVYCIIDLILLDYFMGCFFKKRSIRGRAIQYGMIGGMGLLTHVVTHYDNFMQMIIALLLMISYVCMIYQGKFIHKVIFTMLFDIMTGLITIVVLNIVSYLVHCSIQELISLVTYRRIVIVSMIKIVLYLTIFIIKKVVKPLQTDLPKKYYYMIITFFIISFSSTLAIFKMSLSNMMSLFNVEIIILGLVLLISNLMIYPMFTKVIQAIKNETRLYWILKNQELLEGNIVSLEESYQEIKKIKHDLINHYRVIEGLLDIGETNQCKQYVTHLKQDVQKVPIYYKTGNSVADTVINQKVYFNRHLNIDFDIKVYFPPKVKLEETDLGSMLFNLIDNAIEAIREVEPKKRKININIHPYEQDLLINIKNTVAHNPIKGNQLVRRNKEDQSNHGYGMLNIKYVVEKYQGQLNYRCENQMFEVSVLLKNIA